MKYIAIILVLVGCAHETHSGNVCVAGTNGRIIAPAGGGGGWYYVQFDGIREAEAFSPYVIKKGPCLTPPKAGE